MNIPALPKRPCALSAACLLCLLLLAGLALAFSAPARAQAQAPARAQDAALSPDALSPDALSPETLPLLVEDAANTPTLPRRFRTSAFPFEHGQGKGVSRQGLADLRISGSAQFSARQLDALLANLPGSLTVVDLRQESHGFINGAAVSWYGKRNWANRGQGLLQVLADEGARLAGLRASGRAELATEFAKSPQGVPSVRTRQSQDVADAAEEGELLARRGAGYFRIAAPDHIRPTDDNVERFIRFYRGRAAGTWLHFHCRAGHGRTTTFMLLTDMLENAGRVGFADLAERQRLLGGARLVGAQKEDEQWRWQGDREREAFLRLFYQYARANPRARPLSWEEWLARPDGAVPRAAATPPSK